ncbi:hypothetical protein BDA99DRAFT_502164 [Phascolomyces articulosus]|uniref:Uncharacterized protein n=1 Tax=Phascolomyces articulosus TaxID=60185 RepID=A0AAD5K611_9FUNG|nr:hypothetical protein BDA99DRAFT_502164 [Phascolomyces articulosus]
MRKSKEKRRVEFINRTFVPYHCSTLYSFDAAQSKKKSRWKTALADKLCTAFELSTNIGQPRQKQRKISIEEGELKDIIIEEFSIVGWDSPCFPVNITINIRHREEERPSTNTIVMIPAKEQPAILGAWSYPLLLIRANPLVWAEVAEWLRYAFDCDLYPLNKPFLNLERLGEWCAQQLSNEEGTGGKLKNLDLRFSTKYKPKTDPFDISPEPKVGPVQALLDVAEINDIFEMIGENKKSFIEAVQTRIQVDADEEIRSKLLFTLIKVSSPNVLLDLNVNKIKILSGTTNEQLNQIIDILCNILSSSK